MYHRCRRREGARRGARTPSPAPAVAGAGGGSIMRHPVLALLAGGAAHGYELKQALDGVFGNVWPPINVGQIYTTLQRLERDGLVEGAHVAQAHRPDKRVYALTPAG